MEDVLKTIKGVRRADKAVYVGKIVIRETIESDSVQSFAGATH